MNNYIKHLVEGFDFNSVKKQNKKINAVDVVLRPIIQKIYNREQLSKDEYSRLKGFTGIYKVLERDELEDLIKYFIEQFDIECNLNWIDVSNVTNMNRMFSYSKFNGDISKWDVGNVTNMSFMFQESQFNGDISKWNVSNVINMNRMFCCASFNRDISQWNVSNVTDMSGMFLLSKFNGDISQWNVSNVTDMNRMFAGSKFNGDISQWNVSNVIDKYKMFYGCQIKSKYKPKFK